MQILCIALWFLSLYEMERYHYFVTEYTARSLDYFSMHYAQLHGLGIGIIRTKIIWFIFNTVYAITVWLFQKSLLSASQWKSRDENSGFLNLCPFHSNLFVWTDQSTDFGGIIYGQTGRCWEGTAVEYFVTLKEECFFLLMSFEYVLLK